MSLRFPIDVDPGRTTSLSVAFTDQSCWWNRGKFIGRGQGVRRDRGGCHAQPVADRMRRFQRQGEAAAVPLSADALKLGLLPASDFETGVKWDTESPSTITDDVALTQDAGCRWLVYGGPRGTEIAAADVSGDVFTDIKDFYERASQYRPGGAASVLATMVDQSNGKCAKHTSTLPYGEVTSNTTTVTPESGLGDKADLFEMKVQTVSGANPLVYDTLTVEYGDVLISVGCLGTPEFLHSCDLDAKAKKVAGQLKLM